jgi:hypothetical protein
VLTAFCQLADGSVGPSGGGSTSVFRQIVAEPGACHSFRTSQCYIPEPLALPRLDTLGKRGCNSALRTNHEEFEMLDRRRTDDYT